MSIIAKITAQKLLIENTVLLNNTTQMKTTLFMHYLVHLTTGINTVLY